MVTHNAMGVRRPLPRPCAGGAYTVALACHFEMFNLHTNNHEIEAQDHLAPAGKHQ